MSAACSTRLRSPTASPSPRSLRRVVGPEVPCAESAMDDRRSRRKGCSVRPPRLLELMRLSAAEFLRRVVDPDQEDRLALSLRRRCKYWAGGRPHVDAGNGTT